MLAEVKKTCKRVVGAADDDISVISPRDWAEGFAKNPIQRVRRPPPPFSCIPTLIRSTPCRLWTMLSRSSPSLVGSLVTVRPLSLPFYLRHLLTVSHTRVQTDLGWLSGDVIAGLTVGIVGVPQSMSYAQVRPLSNLHGRASRVLSSESRSPRSILNTVYILPSSAFWSTA